MPVAVQGNCAVELKLDECLGRLIAHAKAVPTTSNAVAARATSLGSSAPTPKVLSWLNLPALPAFTASVRTHSDCGGFTDVTPPLSSYAHDAALMEVAKHGSKGAQIVTQPSADVCGDNDAEPSQGEITTHIGLRKVGHPMKHEAECVQPLLMGRCP